MSDNKETKQARHGHVTPRPDGMRARCGGPAICRICQAEQSDLEAKQARCDAVYAALDERAKRFVSRESVDEVLAALQTLDAQAPAVEANERELDAHLIDRMSKLLAEIALILNGEPAPLTRPSYHDLPDKVRALQCEVELLRAKEAPAVEAGARDERAAWFAVATGAAASLENAAACMTDPELKSAAKGAAAYTRKRANDLWNAQASAPPFGSGLVPLKVYAATSGALARLHEICLRYGCGNEVMHEWLERTLARASEAAAGEPLSQDMRIADLLDRLEDMRIASKDEGHDTEDSMTLADAINSILRLADNQSAQAALEPNENHECIYENGDGVCRECAALAEQKKVFGYARKINYRITGQMPEDHELCCADAPGAYPLYAAPQPASEQQIEQEAKARAFDTVNQFAQTKGYRDGLHAIQAAPCEQPASEQQALTDGDVFTLIGHAENLRAMGQSDMPAWFMGLAERIAETIGDKALADRTRALAAKGDGHVDK